MGKLSDFELSVGCLPKGEESAPVSEVCCDAHSAIAVDGKDESGKLTGNSMIEEGLVLLVGTHAGLLDNSASHAHNVGIEGLSRCLLVGLRLTTGKQSLVGWDVEHRLHLDVTSAKLIE